MNNPKAPGPRNGILSLTIKDKSVLYAAYMPFVKHGGLFIPTNKNYRLGSPPSVRKVTVLPVLACSSVTRTTPRAARSKPILPAHSNPTDLPTLCNPCSLTRIAI